MPRIKIIKSSVLGCCMGVSHAMEMVEKLIQSRTNYEVYFPIYTYGPLIHNQIVLKDLSQKGVAILSGNEDLTDAHVVIRAHGISPIIQDYLEKSGAHLYDATCPKVKANQILAQQLCDEGWTVLIAGQTEHAEIVGILGYAPNCICLADINDYKKIELSLSETKKIALISQTTFPDEQFNIIAAAVKEKFKNIIIKNTICPATMERQRALLDLCGKVDIIVIAGGVESANTNALLSIARSMQKYAVLAASGKELVAKLSFIKKEEILLGKKEIILGIASGASTPVYQIEEICKALTMFNE